MAVAASVLKAGFASAFDASVFDGGGFGETRFDDLCAAGSSPPQVGFGADASHPVSEEGQAKKNRGNRRAKGRKCDKFSGNCRTPNERLAHIRKRLRTSMAKTTLHNYHNGGATSISVLMAETGFASASADSARGKRLLEKPAFWRALLRLRPTPESVEGRREETREERSDYSSVVEAARAAAEEIGLSLEKPETHACRFAEGATEAYVTFQFADPAAAPAASSTLSKPKRAALPSAPLADSDAARPEESVPHSIDLAAISARWFEARQQRLQSLELGSAVISAASRFILWRPQRTAAEAH